ncbi:MAG TPA: AAA family ATPase, partial [Thermomicrobiales bacterium]|nr:AAA family ATPase [Thermomicrobiales bacterium]
MSPRSSATPPDDDCREALVGRARELALLRERLAAALAGRGGLVAIGGEAGVGKTTLARALLREAAARGALLATGAGYDLAATPAYGPWAEVFGHLAAGGELPPLPAAILPPGQSGGTDAGASQAALFARLRDALATAAARRPLVLLLEDLQWADADSLDLLCYLVHQAAALPLLLVATYRTDERPRHHPTAARLTGLVHATGGLALDLERLDRDAIRAFVRARYCLPAHDESRLAAYLDARTRGNPFFMAELLRALVAAAILRSSAAGWALGDLAGFGLPLYLQQVIVGRAGRLGEPIVRALSMAAVVGQDVPLALWGAVSGLDEDALLDVVERAADAHLLEETPDGAAVRFRHALLREALYRDIHPARRRSWHRRVGEALTATPDAAPDAVADQFRRAGDARAVPWLVAAGERAQRAYAWLTAATHYEAALAILGQCGTAAGERGWLLLRLALLRRYDDSRAAGA